MKDCFARNRKVWKQRLRLGRNGRSFENVY